MASFDKYMAEAQRTQGQGAGCAGDAPRKVEPEDTLPDLTKKIVENGRKLLGLRPAYQMYVEAIEEGNDLRERFDRAVKRAAKE